MNEPNDRMDDIDRVLHEELNSEIPPEVKGRFRSRLAEFRERLDERELARGPRRGGLFPLRRLLWAGAGTVAVVALVVALVGGRAEITWADVVESFRSVRFFSATMYYRDQLTADLEQFEIWMGRGGKARVKAGTQVVFGRDGKVVKAYDIEKRRETEPNSIAAQILEMLGSGGEFSLDTVLRSFPGELTDAAPVLNEEASIGLEVAVFDLTNSRTPEWVRIWTLRKSKLPFWIRVWNPRGGDCSDVLFSYSKEQPAEFFDPEAFAEKLTDPSVTKTDIAYAYLAEPGGHEVGPGDLGETIPVSFPQISKVIMSEYGLVFVESQIDLSARGKLITYLDSLEDDLGTEYFWVEKRSTNVRVTEGTEDPKGTVVDRSGVMFIPMDVGLNRREPSVLRFHCEAGGKGGIPSRILHTEEVTEWRRGDIPVDKISPPDWRIWLPQVAEKHLLKRQWDEMERVLDMIPGELGTDDGYGYMAMRREGIRLAGLVQRSRWDEAAALGESLVPVIRGKVYGRVSDDRVPILEDTITALVESGRKEDARKVLEEVKSEMTPEQRKTYEEKVKTEYLRQQHAIWKLER